MPSRTSSSRTHRSKRFNAMNLNSATASVCIKHNANHHFTVTSAETSITLDVENASSGMDGAFLFDCERPEASPEPGDINIIFPVGTYYNDTTSTGNALPLPFRAKILVKYIVLHSGGLALEINTLNN